VGAFGVNWAVAFHEDWNHAQPRTSYTFTSLQPGDHAYRVCLNYHTLIIYSNGDTYDGSPELCPPLPAGGTVSGGSSGPPAGGSTPASPTNLRLTATPRRPTAILLNFSVQSTIQNPGDRFIVRRHNPVDTSRSAIIADVRRPALAALVGYVIDTDVKPNTAYFYSACFQVELFDAFNLCTALVSTSVAVPLPPTPTNLHTKPNTLGQVELAWTPNITDGMAMTEFDIYRDGVRLATRAWYPVENHFFVERQPGIVHYTVCAVDHRGTPDEVRSCSADLRVLPLGGTTEFDPNEPPAALQR
jgi:hypothetical protein